MGRGPAEEDTACINSSAITYSPLDRLLIELPNSSQAILDQVQGEFLFLALCWWPYEDLPPPSVFGEPWRYESLFERGAELVVSRSPTASTPSRCVLQRASWDRLWVDGNQHQKVLRREISNPNTGKLAAVYQYADYQEAAEGVWLPRQIKSTQYDSNDESESLRGPVIDTAFRLDYRAINGDVEALLFEPSLLPGSLRKTQGDPPQYEPLDDGGEEYAAALLEWSKATVSRSRKSGLLTKQDLVAAAPWAVAGLAAGLLLRTQASA